MGEELKIQGTRTVESTSQAAPSAPGLTQAHPAKVRTYNFKPGKSGNPKGKPKGAIQVKTRILHGFIEDVLNGGQEKYLKELKKLKGRAYVEAYNVLLEYVLPKKQRVESVNVNLTTKEPQTIKIGENEFTINP